MDPVKSSTISAFSKFWKDVSRSTVLDKKIEKMMIENLSFLAANECKVTYGQSGELRARTLGEDNGFKWSSSVQPANMKVFCNTVKKFAESAYFTHCNAAEIESFLTKITGAIKGLDNLLEKHYKSADANRIAILNKSKEHLQAGADSLSHLLGIIELIAQDSKINPHLCFSSIEEGLVNLNCNDARYEALGLTHRNGIIKPIKDKTFKPVKQIPLSSKFEISLQQLPLILNQLNTFSLEDREQYITAFFCRHLELESAVVDAEKQLEELYEPLLANDDKAPQIRKLAEGFDSELEQVNKTALQAAKQALAAYHKELASFVNGFSNQGCSRKQFKALEEQFKSQFNADPELVAIYNDLATKPVASQSKALVKHEKQASRAMSDTKANALAFSGMAFVGTATLLGSTLCPPAAPGLIAVGTATIGFIEVAREKGKEGLMEAFSGLKQEDINKGIETATGIVQAFKGMEQPAAAPADASTAPVNSTVPQIKANKGPKIEKAATDDES